MQITGYTIQSNRLYNEHTSKENLLTHIYAKDFVNTIHVRKTTDNFPYDSVETRAESAARDNASVHIIRSKVYLNSIRLGVGELKQIYYSFLNMLNICKQPREITFCRGPARLKCTPLGPSL